MNTVRYAIVVLCLAFAFSAANMAGLPAALGIEATAPSGGTLGDTLNESAGDSPVGGGEIGGQVDGTDDQSIISVALNGVTFLLTIASGVALLPVTLQNLGLPYYFALPAGLSMQAIAGVGILQFLTQREWF